MRSEETSIGARVRVGECGLRSELRGLTGKIIGRWGHPEYLALDVRMEDGSSSLFWHHELDSKQFLHALGWIGFTNLDRSW